jgi:transcriptional regulator
MYLPAHFAETDRNVLHALMRSHRLATIVRITPAGLDADHIPLLLDSDAGMHGKLFGHVARANPLWQDADGQNVLVIFQGPEAYITPSWYASKAEHGKVVPTWNYAVVHATGTLTAHDDADWLHAHVTQSTDTSEARLAKPWKVSDAPDDYIRATARAIVGIEIAIQSVVGKWKVSQNRSANDRAGVISGLAADSQRDAAAIAALVPKP